jgi:hypothetical protein
MRCWVAVAAAGSILACASAPSPHAQRVLDAYDALHTAEVAREAACPTVLRVSDCERLQTESLEDACIDRIKVPNLRSKAARDWLKQQKATCARQAGEDAARLCSSGPSEKDEDCRAADAAVTRAEEALKNAESAGM